ncbi:MAG: RNA polymerase factor sigma-54 [Alphaproteobacteria bacterium]|nr:RNA polymerase factor sigma-54 [Alphaproteobacteria bacterium]
MAQKVGLELWQGTQLAMTPQLQQAIKLLQFNSAELAEYLSKEVEKNPLLELAGDEPKGQTSGSDAQSRDAANEQDQTIHPNSTNEQMRGKDKGDDNGARNDDGFYQGDQTIGRGGQFSNGGDNDVLQQLQQKESLQEHLLREINLLFADDDNDKKVASVFLGLIEETGWLSANWAEEMKLLNIPTASSDRVLKKLQTLEPAGVFCRNLKECLSMQLADKQLLTPAMQKLLDNLNCFLSGNEKKLLEVIGIKREEVMELITILRAQDPKPGLKYQFHPHIAIEPDLLVFRNSSGEWLVELNHRAQPGAVLNEHSYHRFLQSPQLQKKDKQFLREKFYAAKWLVKSLEQRRNTMLKVARKIIELQKDFFDYGMENLKPLVLRDIATAIGMHESTISRVTTNKFMATPRGLLEMKFFFSQALENSDGDKSVSAEVVRHYIKTIIEREQPDKVLSDDVIVENLKAQGFQVARRTVAKYRESLAIPSSIVRRKRKNNFLYGR